MPRPKLSSAAEIAVHAEKLDNLEESSRQHDTALGAIMREMSEMREEMAEKLGKICAKLDAKPEASKEAPDNLKLGAVIACVTALSQVIVELAKALISLAH